MVTSLMERARDFLAQRRIALVGASRDPRGFSRKLLRALVRRGYDVVPVNPALDAIDGMRCFARVQDVQPPAEAALLLTSADHSERVIADCVEAGVGRVWLHQGSGPGAASNLGIGLCEAHGISVVAGLCPFMVLKGTGLQHRIHGFFRRRALARGEVHPAPSHVLGCRPRRRGR